MERTGRGGEAINKQKKKKEPINVIFMRKQGRIFSMDISGRMILLTFLFAVVYVVFSVVIINRYWELKYEYRNLRQRAATLDRTLDEYQFQSQVLNQYHQLVQQLNQVEDGEEPAPAEEKVAAVRPEPVQESRPQTPAPAAPEEDQSGVPGEEPPENPVVDAMELSLDPSRNGRSLSFRFRIANIHPDNKEVSGYLFVVVETLSEGLPHLAPYPEVELQDGDPADYRRGTAFSIKYGKSVRGRIDGLKKADEYTQAWVYIYDDDGELIMKKLLSTEND
jgi:hypothetical protein